MKINSAKFLTSVVSREKILYTNLNEFAFVGRSNCGKSSLINSITNQSKLAKTSSMPGLTKMINYFLINSNQSLEELEKGDSYENSFLLVDLPGYGFSKAGKANHDLWSTLIENYLRTSKKLKCVFVLMDIRHLPNELDKIMIDFLYSRNISFKIVATKADKIPKTKICHRLNDIAKTLKLAPGNILPYSSESNFNREKIIEIFENLK